MVKKYIVYKLLGVEGEPLYIGQTTDLRSRISTHFSKSKMSEYIYSVEYTELKSPQDMNFLETFLIKKLAPKFNETSNDKEYVNISFDITGKIEWKLFDHEKLVRNLSTTTNNLEVTRFYCEFNRMLYTFNKEKVEKPIEDGWKGTIYLISNGFSYSTGKRRQNREFILTQDLNEVKKYKRFDTVTTDLSKMREDCFIEEYVDGELNEILSLPRTFYEDRQFIQEKINNKEDIEMNINTKER